MTTFQISWAVKLIERLRALYGNKFMQMWDGIDKAELAQMWAEELDGFTGEEIAKGLRSCKAMPWPPALPEFMNLCRPPVQPEAAFYEAVTGLNARKRGEVGIWSHPAIFFTAVAVGQHDVLNNGYQQIKARWVNALNKQLEKQSWPEIPEPAKALPPPQRTEMTDEQAKKTMEKIGAADVFKKPKDPKAWARKILDNPSGRSPAVINMAKRALEEVPA